MTNNYQDAYELGYDAFQDGKKIYENPYIDENARKDWFEGWRDAEFDKAN